METTVHTVNNFLCETMRWRPKRLRRSSSVDTRTGYWSLWEGECVCSALIKGPDRRSVSVRNRSFYKPWSTTSGNKTWHPPWLCLLVLSCHPDRHKYQLMIVIKAAGGVNPAWVSSLWWDLLSADVRRGFLDGREGGAGAGPQKRGRLEPHKSSAGGLEPLQACSLVPHTVCLYWLPVHTVQYGPLNMFEQERKTKGRGLTRHKVPFLPLFVAIHFSLLPDKLLPLST